MSFVPHRPQSVNEAIAIAERYGPRAGFLAGGTLLAMQFAQRDWTPEHVILLGGVEELVGVVDRDERVVIGAMTTLRDVARERAFAGPLGGVADAARVIGGPQIQNIGTVGGNIAVGSSVSDLLPPLLALDAEVVFVGPSGERRVSIRTFLGDDAAETKPGEVIHSVLLPKLPASSASAYVKIGRRKAMEIAIVSVAARLTVDPYTGLCRDVRVAIGAIADVVYRAADAEQLVEGASPVGIVFDQAGHLAAEAAKPIYDLRASETYRRLLIEALVPRALRLCVGRIAGARS